MPQIFSRAFLRQPALSADGSRIAFTSGGDIWIAPSTGGTAQRLTAHSNVDAYPIFSPDDRYLAFASYRTGGGNIYVTDFNADHLPRQITWHSSSAPPQAWSPDSEWIYFTGRYDGLSGAIYKVRRSGGQPIEVARLSMETFYGIAVSPDGGSIVFCNNGDAWWRKGPNPAQSSDLWLLQDGKFHKLTNGNGRNIRPMWNAGGDGIYYLSNNDGVENIYYLDLNTQQQAIAVTTFTDGRLTRPAISADGSTMTFERQFQLWKMEVGSGLAKPIRLKLDRDEKRNPVNYYEFRSGIREFALSDDRKKVAFSIRGNLFADIVEKDAKKRDSGLSFALPSSGCREEMVHWHPESKEVFYISDREGEPQIYAYNFVSREERKITNRGAAKYSPQVSPDGKWLAFINGQQEIRLIELASGRNRKFIADQLFISLPDPTDFSWSPDSQWIAFVASDEKFFSNIYVQKLGWKTPRQLTFLSNLSAYNPMWSRDGKYLLFNSGQYRAEGQIVLVELKSPQVNFKEDHFHDLFSEKNDKDKDQSESANGKGDDSAENSNADGGQKNGKKEKKDKEEKIVKTEIAFEGIKQRIRFLTDYRINAWLHGISPDSRLAVFSAVTFGETGLWAIKLDPEKRHLQPSFLVNAIPRGNVSFTKDAKKMYYLSGGRLNKLALTSDGEKSGNPSKISILAPLTIDFHRDKKHIFDEAWRLLNAHFYDAGHHGADWKKVKRRLQPVVEGIQVRDELVELLNLMVGELNASHLGAGAWQGYAPDSYHGLLFDQQELEKNGFFRIAHVLAESPAALVEEPPVPGEYLLQINGEKLKAETNNMAQLMHHQAGRKTALLIGKKPGGKPERTIYVKPVAADEHYQLQYRIWKLRNQQYVDQRSAGKLGYVHIPAMSHSAYMAFLTDLDTEVHRRQGVVIDIRFNGGGHIAPFILDVLSRKAYALSSWRGGAQNSDTHFAGSRILALPTILLTNEHSGSNAEVFSEGYRQLSLGKVVGKPTMGAVIWTSGVMLKDGITFRVPRFKSATLYGENTEGKGRPVDIDVDRDLSEDQAGSDSQLDAAVDQLLKDIET